MEETKIAIFKGKKVRRIIHNGEWWFSVVDIVEVLTGSDRPRKYWNDLKVKLAKEGYIEVSDKIGHLKLSAPGGIHRPVKLDVTSEKTQHVKRLLTKSYGKEVLHKHVGGAIPVVLSFQEVLKANTVLVPMANSDCNMHGLEENFKVDLLKKGLDFSRQFFEKNVIIT